jgi:hypothetical protein
MESILPEKKTSRASNQTSPLGRRTLNTSPKKARTLSPLGVIESDGQFEAA